MADLKVLQEKIESRAKIKLSDDVDALTLGEAYKSGNLLTRHVTIALDDLADLGENIPITDLLERVRTLIYKRNLEAYIGKVTEKFLEDVEKKKVEP